MSANEKKDNAMAKTTDQIENINASEILSRLDRLSDAVEKLQGGGAPDGFGYISRTDLARLLGVSLPAIHDWTRAGILTLYKLGGKSFYRREEIEAAFVRQSR
jgi:hypothetical protein